MIKGTAYSSDCLILGNSVQAHWRREQGHLLEVEDLQPVIDSKPSILVVGCGAYGQMNVSENVGEILLEHGIELFIDNTHKAVAKFNELADKGEIVAAALHLTC